jgi:hypothetical protein
MREVLIELLAARPFRKMVIVMNGASRYEVTNPDFVVWGRDVLNLYHERSDRYDIVRLAEISSVEIIGPAV